MNFASDNWAGAHPKIGEALANNAAGFAPAYGTSDLDRAVEERFSAIFERDVAVFFVATGTAANSLSLAAAARPGGVAFAHSEAHLIEDECGAPEYITGGMRLRGVHGTLGRMEADALKEEIARFPPNFIHAGQPAAVSITQSTEIGTIYGLQHIEAIANVCREHSLPLHMDGARFANALVRLGCSPAEMTWKSGIDILSFGGTKNGCWCAEAIIVFKPELTREMPYLRKRAAQLFSKSRFVAAQFLAYFNDDLWLENARHANAMAARLAAAIARSNSARLAWNPDANEVFAIVEDGRAKALKAAGAVFHPWQAPASYKDPLKDGEGIYRLVTSFATEEQDIDRFSALLEQ